MSEPSSCPTIPDLEAFAASGTGDETLEEHVRRCGVCSRKVRRIRADNELIADYVSANRDRLQSASTPSAVPEIDGYELNAEIHRGAQGVIFDAIQTTTKRRVAVKTLAQGAFATVRQRRRFEREVELIAVLRHPHIVTIYDSGRTADGGHFLAMEYVEGVELDKHLRGSLCRGPKRDRLAALRRRLTLFVKVCDAVNTAHQRGIIHRDLKPENILVDERGDPHVLDFGLAKQEPGSGSDSRIFGQIDDDSTTGTVIGEFLGTFAYASPEQAGADPAAIDVRSDVYALGIILFEMVTGKRPYALTGSTDDVIDTIKTAKPPAASSINDAIDADLDSVIAKALAKDREQRYQTAGELRDEVQRNMAGEPVAVRGHSTMYVLRKLIGRHKAGTAAAVVAGLAFPALVITAGMFFFDTRAADRTAEAERQRDLIADTMEEVMGSLEDCRGTTQSPDETMRCVRDRWDRIIDARLAGAPAMEARARTALARIALQQSEPTLAVTFAEDALVLQEQGGDEPLRLADTLHVLGSAQLAAKRPEMARSALARALALRRALLPPDDWRIAQTEGLLRECEG